MELDPLVVKLILDSSEYTSNLKGADTQTTNTGANIKGILGSVGLGGVVAFASVTGAIGGTIAALQACVTTSQDYLQTIEDISLLSGTTADETARLVSVMGRYGITSQQINLASRTLAREGLSLTIASLQDMANQYDTLATAADKEAFLMKNFGARGGTAFVKMMDAGSTAIGDLAAQTDQALIPTGEMMKMTDDMEGSTHRLSDAWTGFQLQIGTQIIPSLIGLMTNLVPVVDNLMKIVGALEFIYKWGTAAGWSGTLSDLLLGKGGNSGAENPANRTPATVSPRWEGASGTQGWQTVPAGFPNDSYGIGLSSGETFAVNSKGNNAGIDYRKLARAIRDALNG